MSFVLPRTLLFLNKKISSLKFYSKFIIVSTKWHQHHSFLEPHHFLYLVITTTIFKLKHTGLDRVILVVDVPQSIYYFMILERNMIINYYIISLLLNFFFYFWHKASESGTKLIFTNLAFYPLRWIYYYVWI